MYVSPILMEGNRNGLVVPAFNGSRLNSLLVQLLAAAHSFLELNNDCEAPNSCFGREQRLHRVAVQAFLLLMRHSDETPAYHNSSRFGT